MPVCYWESGIPKHLLSYTQTCHFIYILYTAEMWESIRSIHFSPNTLITRVEAHYRSCEVQSDSVRDTRSTNPWPSLQFSQTSRIYCPKSWIIQRRDGGTANHRFHYRVNWPPPSPHALPSSSPRSQSKLSHCFPAIMQLKPAAKNSLPAWLLSSCSNKQPLLPLHRQTGGGRTWMRQRPRRWQQPAGFYPAGDADEQTLKGLSGNPRDFYSEEFMYFDKVSLHTRFIGRHICV